MTKEFLKGNSKLGKETNLNNLRHRNCRIGNKLINRVDSSVRISTRFKEKVSSTFSNGSHFNNVSYHNEFRLGPSLLFDMSS